jgi:hypothetical protein
MNDSTSLNGPQNIPQANSLEATSPVQSSTALAPSASHPVDVSQLPVMQQRRHKRQLLIATSVAIFMAIGGGGGLLLARAQSADQPAAHTLTIKSQAVQLGDLSKRLSANSQQPLNTLTVNGQVVVDSSLVLAAADRPAQPVAGQIYYDRGTNALTFYNGRDNVGLLGGNVINTQVTNAPVSTSITNVNQFVTNLTNLTNVTNVNGGGLNGNGTTGSIAMFTAGGVLGDSLISQTAGNLQLATAASNSASGNIAITTGNSSTTASGNISIDSGTNIINGTVVATKGFEGGVDDMQDWFNTSIGITSAQAHQGTQSLQVTPSSAFWGVTDDFNAAGAPVVPGHQYNFSAWVRAASTGRTITGQIVWYPAGTTTNFSATADNNSSWVQMSLTAPAPAGSSKAFYRFQTSTGAASEVHYFDDFVTTDLSSSSAFSAIEIGTTNAKVITIGNMNMISATTIMGASGINLNAGAANLMAVGGVLDFTGNSASTIKTTAGALTLTSADTTTWGVATATSGNGGDLTLRAGNGEPFGNTDGGNLILQAGKANGTGLGGGVIVKPLTDTTNTFEVQSAAANKVFSVDSTDQTVGIGTSGATTSAKLHIETGSKDALVVNQSGSSNLLDLQNNNVSVVSVTSSGATTYKNSTDSTTAFQIQASSGASLLTADTQNGAINLDGITTITNGEDLILSAASGVPTDPGDIYFNDNNGTQRGGLFTSIGGAAVLNLTAGDGTADLSVYDGGINIGGNLETGGIARLDNAGALQNISSYSQTGGSLTIQTAGSATLFTADTTTLALKVSGSSSTAFATLELQNAHFRSTQTTAPTIATPTNCGTSPSAAVTAGSTDAAGSFTVTTGTGGTSSSCDTFLTFQRTYGAAPKTIIVVGRTNAASAQRQVYVSASSATTFTVAFATSAAGANSTTYSFSYWVVE